MPMDYEDLRLRLLQLIAAASRKSADLEITVVCNRRHSIPEITDFAEHSVRTEFYSDSEFSEVIGSLRGRGVYVAGILDEQEFLERASTLRRQNTWDILMNFGSARLGPWGKTLVPSLAEASGWVTTNSNSYAIALARHKFHCAAILAGMGIRSARTWCYSANDGWLGNQRPHSGTPVLVQPAFESASIGVSLDSKQIVDVGLDQYCHEMTAQFRQDVVIREFVPGYEAEVPVVRIESPQSLQPIGIAVEGKRQLGDLFLTYSCVRDDAYGFYPFIEETTAETITALRETAEDV